MESEYETVPKLSNGISLNDLEWPLTQISKSQYYSMPNWYKIECSCIVVNCIVAVEHQIWKDILLSSVSRRETILRYGTPLYYLLLEMTGILIICTLYRYVKIIICKCNFNWICSFSDWLNFLTIFIDSVFLYSGLLTVWLIHYFKQLTVKYIQLYSPRLAAE